MIDVWKAFSFSSVKKTELKDIMKDVLELKAVGIVKASLRRWLSNYTAVRNLKKSLQAVVM
jgi:hypothetical protein